MQQRIPVPPEVSLKFTEVAQSTRLYGHAMNATGDPRPDSSFALVNDYYPFEKVSDRARSYVDAALQHLTMWADFHAPLKFHPEQSVTITLRPTMALARSALEAGAQAVWLMDTKEPLECVKRHLSLIRWDLEEHRKSRQGDEQHRKAVKARDSDLLERVSNVFNEEQIKPPNGYLDVIKKACAPDDLALEAKEVERVWRAASGAAHGMYWVNLDLTDTTVGEEYEEGHFRTVAIPNPGLLFEALDTANKMTQYAALKFLLYSGADITALLADASRWLAANFTPIDPDSEVLKHLKEGRIPPEE